MPHARMEFGDAVGASRLAGAFFFVHGVYNI